MCIRDSTTILSLVHSIFGENPYELKEIINRWMLGKNDQLKELLKKTGKEIQLPLIPTDSRSGLYFFQYLAGYAGDRTGQVTSFLRSIADYDYIVQHSDSFFHEMCIRDSPSHNHWFHHCRC